MTEIEYQQARATEQSWLERRQRLDRFVLAVLAGDSAIDGKITDMEIYAKAICDIAEAVLAELERREKGGQ